MYGVQPAAYGQYGYPGYQYPGQAPGTPGAQPDPNAAAAAAAGQAGQQQWAGADPTGYYSNYWGGM